MTKLSTEKYETNTYEITEDFTNINVNVKMINITVMKSETETASVVCMESKKIKYDVSVSNGVLVVEVDNNRRWYDFSFESVKINSHTGDVSLTSSSDEVNIKLSTGNIKLENINIDNASLVTATGNHYLKNVVATNNVFIESSTGTITLNNVDCKNLTAITDTGRVKLTDVIATGRFEISTETGGVTLEDSDASEMNIETSTGSVKGTILTPKIFMARSDTGKINVPETTTGGICRIRTSTGNISITIKG
jgi:DUF4097 and DUF4098 domain-containing protein YvlB